MSRKKPMIIVAAAIGFLLLIALAVWSATRHSTPDFLRDNASPNAYDDFLKAETLLRAGSNRPAFDLLRQGLQRRFEAPLESYDLPTFAATVMPNMATLKRLGQALTAEGESAENDGKHREAANTYLQVVHFGQKIQAGPLIFLLVGLSVEDLGVKALQRVEQDLNESDRAQVASTLQKLAAERITFEEVSRREKYFGRRTALTPFHYLVSLRMMRPAIMTAQAKYDREVKAERDFIEKLNKPRKPVR